MNSSTNALKIEHYTLGRTLGVGAFGKVKMAKHDITNVNVAIKIINKRKMKNSKMGTKIKREIRLLKYFNHPNIIRLYEVLDTSSDIFVVMEYAERGELFDLIAQRGKLTEADARNFFLQILSGIEYCHNNLVAHRDLKPENILITDNYVVKIADFGLSNLMKDGKYLKTSCGSPNYAAPEVISGKFYCGTDADIWSCGVILYALLAGYLPFDEEDMNALFKKIREADYVMPQHFSPQAKDLISRMLVPDATKRIKFNEIHLHPWARDSSVPFYLMIPFKLDEGRKAINQQVFDRLQRMQVNFHSLNENQIKRAIQRREEKSFVIIYDLLMQQWAVENQANQRIQELIKQELIFDPHVSMTGRYSFNSELLKNDQDKHSLHHQNSIQAKDVHSPMFAFHPKIIVKSLYWCLDQFNCGVKVKNADYRFKATYKDTKTRITKLNSSMEMFSEHQEEESINLMQLSFNEKEKSKSKIKANKYSAKEISFSIQIYRMPDNVNHLLDFQLSRGHPIVFMELCNKLIHLMNRHINNNL